MTRERIGAPSIKCAPPCARLRAADVLAARRGGRDPPRSSCTPCTRPTSRSGPSTSTARTSRSRSSVGARRSPPGSRSAGSRFARGRIALDRWPARCSALFVISCFWRPVELPTKHLTTAAKIDRVRAARAAVVLLFRRPVDVDRFLAVFVAWAVAAACWGVLMFFAIVDDPEGPRPGPARGLVPRPPGLRRVHRAPRSRSASPRSRSGCGRPLAVAAIVGGGLGVILDASVFVYLGSLLAAVAARLDRPPPRHARRSGGSLAIGAILVVVGSGVYVLRGSDVTNYLSFLGISHVAHDRLERRADRLAARDAALDRLADVEDHPSSGSASSARTTDFQPYLAGREAEVPEPARAGLTRRRRTGGACRTSGVELARRHRHRRLRARRRDVRHRARARAAPGAAAVVLRARRGGLDPRGRRNAGTRSGIVAGIPLDAVTWLGFGLAVVALEVSMTRASSPAAPASSARTSCARCSTAATRYACSTTSRPARGRISRGSSVEIVEGELRSYERVHNAVRGVEVVYHLGALGSVPRSVQDPLTSSAVNVEGTLNVLLAARDEGVRRVVFSSSTSVYGVEPRRCRRREDSAARPDLAVRRREARRRALLHLVLARLRGVRDGRAPLLQRLRPAAEPVVAVRGRRAALHHRDRRRRAGHDPRRRRAVARLHLRRERRRRDDRGRGAPRVRAAAPSTSPAARPRASTGSRTRSARSSAGRSRRSSRRRARATSATRGPTSPPPARCSATSPRSRSRRACGGRRGPRLDAAHDALGTSRSASCG